MYEIEKQIDELIYSSDILMEYAHFNDDDPDVVVIRKNKPPVIVVNLNFKTPYPLAARKAHELSHVIYGSDEPMLYHFSIGFKNEAEIIANKGMITLLAKLIYSETPLEYRNYAYFMEYFKLPSWFESVVKDIIKEI